MQNKLKYAAAALILLGAGCSGGATEETADVSDTEQSSGNTEVTLEIVDDSTDQSVDAQAEAETETQEEATPKASAGEGASAETQSQNESNNTTATQRIINMTAKKWEFDPAVIRVNQGDQVKLIIESTDVTHGVFIKAFDVNEVLSPGRATTIEFTANTKGSFPLVCSVPCGSGHGSMTGELIVE